MSKPKKLIRKLYKVTYYTKNIFTKTIVAESKEQATSLAWANCKKGWVDKVEESK